MPDESKDQEMPALQTGIDLQAFRDVERELSRARQSFPESKHQLAALTEEVGELNEAMIEHHRGRLNEHMVYKEAIQVAAMAIRVATEGDADFDYDPGGH